MTHLRPADSQAVGVLTCDFRFIWELRKPDPKMDAQLAVEALIGMGYRDPIDCGDLIREMDDQRAVIRQLREDLKYAEHRYEETDALLWETKQAA